ncbi:DoxX family protein [Actinocorallia longicatena]|uniref:Oxidoreductase n=1 Tax=Actinocorallia longicatena TaxID=111803 RepID=A0ABP6Q619_9ACTN
MRRRPLYDVIALLARTAVGVVFVAHGWLKIQDGLTATGDSFDALGVPLPAAAATYATFTELLGGIAIIIGLGLPVAGTLLFLDMAGAFAFVSYDQGLTAPDGFELVLVLGFASLLFAAGGGGRYTLDRALFPRRREEEPDDKPFLPPEDDEPFPPADDDETRFPEEPPAKELPSDVVVAGRPLDDKE